MNGLNMNGLSGVNGLASTNGLMTTEGGRQIVKYMVRCAYPAGKNLIKQDQSGVTHTFEGGIGVAPEAISGPCDLDCQEKISACMLAHVNNSGAHISIWLVGSDSGIGWGSSPSFPYQEGAFFGNLITNPWRGHYCPGKDMASGEVPGRLGAPLASNVYTNPYGLNVPCTSSCTVSNEGFGQCNDTTPMAPYATGHRWNHVVTVWRNFEPTQTYKICNRLTGKCMGVVGGSTASGAAVEQRTFSGAAGQTWKILTAATGKYKLVNVKSGLALDVNGSQIVQKPYTAAASQQIPVTYQQSQPGVANLKPSSAAAGFAVSSTSEGGIVTLSTNLSSDMAKWTFTAVGVAP